MDFIPLRSATDVTPGPQKISPTDISQYIRLDQCARYLRLRLHERAHGRGFLTRYGVAPQAIPPILTRSGATFEDAIEGQIRALAIDGAEATHCNEAAKTDPRFAAAYHNEVVVTLARDLPPGGLRFLFQPRLQVTVGQWQIRGDVDLLRLERDQAGVLRVLIADMKSSTSAKVEHRLQVAFYHEMLATLFADSGVAASIDTAILYRGPADGALPAAPDEQRVLAEQRAAALARFGVADALLEIVPTPENYRAEVADLVIGPSSTAAQVAQAPFTDLPYHLSYKCDGCLYNELCMKWSAEHDDLSLLPYLADHEKNALRGAGVHTTAEVAALKVFRDPASSELAINPASEVTLRRLTAIPRIGARLDELVHRAKRYRAWKGDAQRALSYIPCKGYGSLPACDSTLHSNLVRVYLDAQHDYLHDRLYMAGSLVVACEGGAEQPERRRSVVHLAEGPPHEPAQERALLVSWIDATLRAIAEVAAPDAEGQPRAPVHLIFYNRFEQRLLLDALARHFGAIAAATPLYDFMTQIAALDSPLVTFLDQEIRELKNYPMVCQSLQAVARQLRFDWNSPEPYRTIFRARMFDDQGRLDEDAEGEGAWYTRRARFNSQIPLEYAYAAWGELERPERGPDEFADYQGATPALLRGFHARRLEAMEHIARDFRGNRDTEKTPFDLGVLAAFSGKARTFADALDEFLTLEHHAKLAVWKQARLAPPERRVLAGSTLIVRYYEADQDPALLEAVRENERRRALVDQLRAEHQARSPGKQFRRTSAQKLATDPLPLPAPYRLRIDLEGVDCDLPTALALSSIRPDERMVFAPRWTVDERLPLEERRPLMPTVKQLLYGRRARLSTIDARSGLVELELDEARGGDWSHGYVFPTVSAFVRPLAEGERYTLDPEPNDWYGYFCKEVVLGLRDGQPNTAYARLAEPASEQVAWPAAAQAGQARFVAGLDALRAVGALHAFDANQRAYIERHGDAPTLLIQGPPGTGKSYATAFALLARLQGALEAGQEFRALLTCKTHAATNVLLEKLAEVQAQLSDLAAQHPRLFQTYFHPRLLDVPLYRVRPSDGAPAGVTMLAKGDSEAATIRGQRWCFAGVTPGGIYGMLKDAGGIFGHGFCDCLVLDEASQMNLPEAAMAALPLRADGQLIVVGDHRQMPPIIAHGWGDERRRTFQEYRAYESLFVTLLGRAPAPPMVKFAESFRLHSVMADFLREEIYAHDGIAYHSRKTAVLADLPHPDEFVARVLAPEYPLVVVVHDEAASQVANPFEQGLVTAILAFLADPAGHGLEHRAGLGVVVPHRAQRAALQAALPQLASRDPATGLLVSSAIDTVERFQGGERRAILVSATESDRDYLRSAGEFLLDPRRLNVALSRAKEKMILVASRSVFSVFNADEELFANAQIWKNLLRRACTVRLWQGMRDGHHVEVWGRASCAPGGAAPIPGDTLDHL
ncbi:MAG: AAA family ATPase [Chloroflexales bacterium]|nr:AAA family ATPase [Chloroflexales bacterium]